MYVIDSRLGKYCYKVRDKLINEYVIENEIKQTQSKQKKLEESFNCILFNCLRQLAFDHYEFVVPLDKTCYSRKMVYNGRYTKRKVSYQYHMDVLDWLIDNNYLMLCKGGATKYEFSEDKQKWVVKEKDKSRLIILSKLANLLKPLSSVSKLWTEPNVVVLRDEKKKECSYRVTPEVREMINNVDSYNKTCRQHVFEYQKKEGENTVTKQTDVQGRKVFNNKSFDNGGRTYLVGGDEQTIQSLSKEERKTVKIDGEDTVELDFCALHPSIAAELQGIKLPETFDPYGVHIEGYDDKTLRKICKKALLIMINSSNKHEAKGALNHEIYQMGIHGKGLVPDVVDTNLVMMAMTEHNKYLSEYFLSGAGVRLQNIDSKIMDYVLSYFNQRGEACVPIHDSVIVKNSQQNEAHKAMTDGYEFVLGSTLNCRVELA